MGDITSIQIFTILHLQEHEICPYPQPNECSSQPSILHCLQIVKCVDIIHRFCSRPPPPISLPLSLSPSLSLPLSLPLSLYLSLSLSL